MIFQDRGSTPVVPRKPSFVSFKERTPSPPPLNPRMAINTFAAIATVVEFTVHCQTRLQSKFKDTADNCLFLTVIRYANLCSLFQNVQGT